MSVELNTTPPMPGSRERALTVTELVSVLALAVEEAIPGAWFQGEIFQFTHASSGHWYFVLKDDESQINACMWKGQAISVSFKPATGMKVLCFGKASIYNRNGKLQILVSQMVQAGEGALQKRFLELKAKLDREGLFAPDRKRILPFFPRTVGLVTSQNGAALHDMLVKFQERMPSLGLYLFDARVQGEGAAQEIVAGIEALGNSGLVDLVIVARGGGSLEDLWAFNEEIVVRAIFRCMVPVISGVGHETDVTLSDLVADVRAPTPTAAAERATPQRSELLRRINDLERRIADTDRWLGPKMQALDHGTIGLERAFSSKIERCKGEFARLEGRARAMHPEQLIRAFNQRINLIEHRLRSSLEAQFVSAQHLLEQFQARLKHSFLAERISGLCERIDRFYERLGRVLEQRVARARQEVLRYNDRLDSLNPLQVLRRGYALVRKTGAIVTSSAQIDTSELVSIQFAEGSAEARIQAVLHAKDSINEEKNDG